MFTKIRTASIGGKGPDVASVWSGSYMLSVGDFLEPMRQYFDDTEFAALSGWPAVTEGFDPSQGDKILGVPNGTDGAMALLYNAEQLDQAGVDPAGWPTDFDSWIGELDKIKSSGVTPLTLGKLNYLYFAYDTWLAQAVGRSARDRRAELRRPAIHRSGDHGRDHEVAAAAGLHGAGRSDHRGHASRAAVVQRQGGDERRRCRRGAATA